MRWRTAIHQRGLFEPRPEECASGVIIGDKLDHRLARRATWWRSTCATAGCSGRTAVSGGIDSEARYDDVHGRSTWAPTTAWSTRSIRASGAIRWSYRGKGAIERRPELGGDAIYVTSATDRVVALEPRSGRLLWQYERESPEGFTIHGHAGPRLHHGLVYTGFSDGYLVALNAGTGDLVWARSLATASEQYVDVDATPALFGEDLLLASSYSGGLYALTVGKRRRALAPGGRGGEQRARDRRPAVFLRAAGRPHRPHRHRRHPVAARPGGRGRPDPAVRRGPLSAVFGEPGRACSWSIASGAACSRSSTPAAACVRAATLGADGRTVYALANSGSVYALSINY